MDPSKVGDNGDFNNLHDNQGADLENEIP